MSLEEDTQSAYLTALLRFFACAVQNKQNANNGFKTQLTRTGRG
jgi:hypothetical protein